MTKSVTMKPGKFEQTHGLDLIWLDLQWASILTTEHWMAEKSTW